MFEEKVNNYYNPFRVSYDSVLKQLKQKFVPKITLICVCCGAKQGKFRYPYILGGRRSLCSKSCYRYYYGIYDIDRHQGNY